MELLSVFVQSQPKGAVSAVDSVLCIEGKGLEGDCHADGSERQLCILPYSAFVQIEKMKTGRPCLERIKANLLIRDCEHVTAGDLLQFDEVNLRITKKGRACHGFCSFSKDADYCPLIENLIFAAVEKGGTLRTNERGVLL